MKPHIRRWFEDSAEIKLKFAAEHAERIEHVAALLVETFRRGNKILAESKMPISARDYIYSTD